MRRFKGIPRQIKPASQGYFEKEPFPGWLHDKDSGERAIEFHVSSVIWKSDSLVEAKGGYYCGGLCAVMYVFKLEMQKGKWVVIQASLKVIS
jgi:hypothetical protein